MTWLTTLILSLGIQLSQAAVVSPRNDKNLTSRSEAWPLWSDQSSYKDASWIKDGNSWLSAAVGAVQYQNNDILKPIFRNKSDLTKQGDPKADTFVAELKDKEGKVQHFDLDFNRVTSYFFDGLEFEPYSTGCAPQALQYAVSRMGWDGVDLKDVKTFTEKGKGEWGLSILTDEAFVGLKVATTMDINTWIQIFSDAKKENSPIILKTNYKEFKYHGGHLPTPGVYLSVLTFAEDIENKGQYLINTWSPTGGKTHRFRTYDQTSNPDGTSGAKFLANIDEMAVAEKIVKKLNLDMEKYKTT